MSGEYDAIVVGARCAGAATAMLLARQGHRVLLVDRAAFPSDTVSTHIVHPPGVSALERWGLRDRLEATGCPPIESYTFDFGPVVISGSPGGVALAPRRIVLDSLLVEGAVEAGAELRERFAVEELLFEDGRVVGVAGRERGGALVRERARVVVGADGRHSFVARAVGAERYHERPTISVAYYAYWSGLPVDALTGYIRPGRGFVVVPTHDGQTMVCANWPATEFLENRTDIEGTFLAAIDLSPELSEPLRNAARETRFAGASDLPNYFTVPFGPGWVLAGDARHHKDPITAQGISDAFRDAEAVAAALDGVLSGAAGFDEALGAYRQAREEAQLPMFELTCEFARLEPPEPDVAALLGAAVGNQEAMDGFARMFAGVVPVPEFFSEENVGRIMAQAGAEERVA